MDLHTLPATREGLQAKADAEHAAWRVRTQEKIAYLTQALQREPPVVTPEEGFFQFHGHWVCTRRKHNFADELIEPATAFANEVGQTVYVCHDWERWLTIRPCSGSLADAQLQARAPVGKRDYIIVYTLPADLPFPAWEALAHARTLRDGAERHNTE